MIYGELVLIFFVGTVVGFIIELHKYVRWSLFLGALTLVVLNYIVSPTSAIAEASSIISWYYLLKLVVFCLGNLLGLSMCKTFKKECFGEQDD